MAETVRLTMAQALVRFMSAQYSERDGVRQPFFAGVFGIFGHGNVAGIGAGAAADARRFRYYQCAQRAGDGAHRRGVRQDEQPPADASPAPRRSVPARPTW